MHMVLGLAGATPWCSALGAGKIKRDRHLPALLDMLAIEPCGCVRSAARDIADKVTALITSSPSKNDRNFRIGVPATYDRRL
jgi:hypothetical protein